MGYKITDNISELGIIEQKLVKFIIDIPEKGKKLIEKIVDIEYDKHLLKILENLPQGILIIYLGFLGVFTLFRVTEQENGLRVVSLATNSMTPAISPGTMVITKKSDIYKKGDIITFYEVSPKSYESTGRTLTHRIIGQRNKEFITKGDSNPHPDPIPVKKDNILGKVYYTIGYIGYFDIAIKTLPGFLVLVLVPFIVLLKAEFAYLKSFKKLF